MNVYFDFTLKGRQPFFLEKLQIRNTIESGIMQIKGPKNYFVIRELHYNQYDWLYILLFGTKVSHIPLKYVNKRVEMR